MFALNTDIGEPCGEPYFCLIGCGPKNEIALEISMRRASPIAEKEMDM